jgi:hypothetical protein
MNHVYEVEFYRVDVLQRTSIWLFSNDEAAINFAADVLEMEIPLTQAVIRRMVDEDTAVYVASITADAPILN